MTPTTKTFPQIVTDQVTAIQGAAIQGAASALVDFTIGAILRAVVEANAALVLWLQGLILQLLAVTRAASSTGTDLDSWCADFGLTRLAAVASTGRVTFARYSTGLAAIIPVGTKLQTSDTNAVPFTVAADTTNINWNATANGYNLAAGVSSIQVPVACSTSGTIGNVQSGMLSVLTQSIPGVDTVANALAFSNGVDAETDDAFRARFVVYISGLSKATKTAIGSAISALGQSVNYSITENVSYAGNSQLGYFYVVADDGSGSPPGSFTSSVSNAVDAVRPFTVSFNVYAPVISSATVVMTVTVASGYNATTVKAAVTAALSAYINALKIGDTLPYTRLAQIAYDTSAGVTNVSAVTLNAGTSDLTADQKHIIRGSTITVN